MDPSHRSDDTTRELPKPSGAPPRVDRLVKPVRCDLFTPPSDDEPAAVEQPTTDPSEGRPTVTASNSKQPTTTHAQLGVNNPKDWIHKMCKDVVSPDTLETAVSQGVHGSTSGTIVASTDKLWPDSSQTIYYCFLPGDHVGSNAQQDKVRNAIKEWSHYANVRFVEEVSPARCDVRITFDPNDGSWSYVGLDSRIIEPQDATMNLAWLQASGSMTANERASILHEFGHVLGLLHEHQSPAQGGTAINPQAALDLYRSGRHWTDKQIQDEIIDVYNQYDVSNYSQVDVTSIMHCPQPKELTGLDHDIGFNKELSDLDKAYMVVQYPRAQPHPETPQWTFEYALKVIGCPESVAQQLRAAKARGTNQGGFIDPTSIRKILSDWTKASHSKGGAMAFKREVAEPKNAPAMMAGPAQPFQMTNELFGRGGIVGGPNGESLSSNYTKVLHSLVPSYEGTEARKQREEMRAWLLADTESSSDANVNAAKGVNHADIPTTAESLRDAKDSFRKSALGSVYTDPSVFPVQMDHKDWHDALDAGYTAEELSQDPALMHAFLRSKD